jgi:surface protein
MVKRMKQQYTRLAALLMVPLFLLLALGFAKTSSVKAAPSDHFVTTWKTDNPGTSNSTSITIPTNGDPGFNYDVDWDNDGTFDEFGLTGTVTHDFGVAGTYTIRIAGTFPSIYFAGGGDKDKILDVNQWGTGVWAGMSGAFSGCSNLDVTATDAPNLSSVVDMGGMFAGASSLVGTSAFGAWNTSNVVSMYNMFNGALQFNQDIGNWNTSNVTTMAYMFNSAGAFNQDISGWDVSGVTDMGYMFGNAHSFNQDISGWDTSSVTSFYGTFSNAWAFNQPIGSWNTSSATTMGWMFGTSGSFNQDISAWDTSNVIDMSYMFYIDTAFNQDISGWNTSSVQDMEFMFGFAENFNQPIGSWDVSSVTDMHDMMKHTHAFDQSLAGWNISNVTDMSDFFLSAGISTANYDATLEAWSLLPLESNVTFDAGDSRYCTSADERTNIITTFGWTITDGGLGVCDPFADLSMTTNDSLTSVVAGYTGYEVTQTIANNGPTTVDTINFDLNFNLCLDITGVTTSGTATDTGSYSSGVWTGELASGQNLVLTFAADITCGGGNGIVFDNAIASSALTSVTLTDSDRSNEDSDEATSILLAATGLSAVTTDGVTSIVEGAESHSFTQTITNNGPLTLDEIVFNPVNTLCFNVTSLNTSGTATDAGAYNGGTQTWGGVLGSGQTLILTFTGEPSCSRDNTMSLTHNVIQLSSGGIAVTDSSEGDDDYADTTAIVGPNSDLSLTKAVNTDQEVTAGGVIKYDITVTNNGYTPVELAQFNGGGENPLASSLIADLAPADLVFVSSSNTDISCIIAMPNLPGSIAPNHTDYQFVMCVYIGSETLEENESISTTLEFSVPEDSDLEFTNYASAGMGPNDPDTQGMSEALTQAFLGGGTVDFLDLFIAGGFNNVNSAPYPVPQEPVEETPSDSNVPGLADTGMNQTALVLLSGGMVVLAGATVKKAITGAARK